MADIATAPKVEITVAGETLLAPVPYVAGHQLTPNEASAMNQLLHENLRNNFARKVEELKKDGKDLQTEFDAYALEYEFGVRGVRTRDPIKQQAIELALQRIKQVLKDKGVSLKDFSAEDLRKKAEEAIEKNPKFLERAKQIVELQQAAAAETDDVSV